MKKYFWIALVIASLNSAAQTLSPNPNTTLSDPITGNVTDSAVGPNGEVVFSGSIVSVNGQARSGIAKLLPSGELDTNFTVDVNGVVSTIVIDAAGSIYIGGTFTSVGGILRNGLAKLSASGTVDSSWVAAPLGTVNAIAVDANNRLYVAGLNRLTRHLATGELDSSWSPTLNPGAEVRAIAISGTEIYAGGTFTTVNGVGRANLVRLSTSTAVVDPQWNPIATGVGSSSSVFDLKLATNALIIAGGSFSFADGQNRTGAAKLAIDGTGVNDASWNTSLSVVSPGPTVESIMVDGSNVYLGGQFTSTISQTRRYLIRTALSGSGTPDSWQPDLTWLPVGFQANVGVRTIALQNGRILAGGRFDRARSASRINLVALDAAAQATSSITDVHGPGTVRVVYRAPDGSFYAGGRFHSSANQNRNVIKFNSAGVVDTSWLVNAADMGTANLEVTSIVQHNGQIYLGGNFRFVNSVSRSGLARVSSSTGELDTTWSPRSDGSVLVLLSDGANAVYAAGSFLSIGCLSRTRVAKLDTLASGECVANAGFDAGVVNNTVLDAVLEPSGLYLAGSFSTIAGVTRTNLAKISRTTGVLDTNWNVTLPPFNSSVVTIAADQNNRVYFAGSFPTVNGNTARSIARVSASTGQLDSGWQPITASINNFFLGRAIKVDMDKLVFSFSGTATFGTAGMRNTLVEISTITGATNSNFATTTNGIITSLQLVGSNVILGGDFARVVDTVRTGIASIQTNVVDSVFRSGFEQP